MILVYFGGEAAKIHQNICVEQILYLLFAAMPQTASTAQKM
jgi:hypothetical protein